MEKNTRFLSLSIVIIVFIAFAGLLLYSYIHKLGYLQKATYLILLILIVTVLLNVLKEFDSKSVFLFWLILLIIFSYGFIDKLYGLHNLLANHYLARIGNNGAPFVQSIYSALFAIIVLFFNKYLTKEYKKNPIWIWLFFSAYLLNIAAIILDFMLHNRLEDYFQLFSLYFFAASFLLAYLNELI